jgi:hypothetical protein
MDELKWPLPWALGEQHESMTRIVAANGVQVCECFASFPFAMDSGRVAKAIVYAVNHPSTEDVGEHLRGNS